jgi:hypothetical protein
MMIVGICAMTVKWLKVSVIIEHWLIKKSSNNVKDFKFLNNQICFQNEIKSETILKK